MSICLDCQHWRRFVLNGREPGTAVLGEYRIEEESPSPAWGWCTLIGLPDGPPEVTAFVQDGSDYRANLWCRADFGCVLYKGTHKNFPSPEGDDRCLECALPWPCPSAPENDASPTNGDASS